MLSLLRRPRKGFRRVDRHDSASPSPGPASQGYASRRHATADFTEADDDGDDSNDEVERFDNEEVEEVDGGEEEEEEQDEHEEADEDQGEDGRRTALPVLPLFSASHLGTLLPSAKTRQLL